MNKIYQLVKDIYETNLEEVKNAINRIFKMFFVAEKEGLLYLEILISEEPDFSEKYFLTKAIHYLCDGKDADKISVLLRNRILTQTDSKQQFLCLLYKDCIELLQKGEHIYYVKEYICSMFPESCEEEIEHFMDMLIEEEYAKRRLEKEMRMPNEFAKVHMELPTKLEEEMERFEAEILLQTNERHIQEWLREMEHFDVCSLLLAGSNEFREIILSNMSKRLRIMIMEDVVLKGNELSTKYNEEIEDIEQALNRGKNALKVAIQSLML